MPDGGLSQLPKSAAAHVFAVWTVFFECLRRALVLDVVALVGARVDAGALTGDGHEVAGEVAVPRRRLHVVHAVADLEAREGKVGKVRL